MSKKIITVFGATGAQGSSVLRALLNNGSYHVNAVTRNANSDKAKHLSSIKDCTVVEADLEDKNSVEKALKGSYGAFVVTDFTAHIKKTEVQQGVNAIDSAIKNGVKHIVFSGLENVEPLLKKNCYHFDFKAQIEKYGLKQEAKINFTSTRLPCYFENFEKMFLHKLKDNQYLVNIPMEGKPMYTMSVDDIGECVLSVFENPEKYKSKLLNLAAENLNISDYVAIMNKHLAPNVFIDSQMTAEKFASLGFHGAEELGVMFEFFQSGHMKRDIALTKNVNKKLHSFETWILENKNRIISGLP